MKLFLYFAVVVACNCFVAANPVGTGGVAAGSPANHEAESDVQNGAQPAAIQSGIDLTRLRKSAYGGSSSYGGSSGYGGSASIQAPLCPKNYLFSCQPNLSPVPCAAPAASYGSAGSYSAPVPTYVAPLRSNIGNVGVGLSIPQPIGYTNQYYQY